MHFQTDRSLCHICISIRKIWANERESHTLAAIRDALLPKLISGELRVRDVEQFLKEREGYVDPTYCEELSLP